METAVDRPSSSSVAVRDTGAVYDEASHAEATRTAYTSDARCWGRWLTMHAIPLADATPAHVASYFAHLADEGYAAATISRRYAAVRALYRTAGIADPTDAEAVTRRLRGINRTIGTAQKKARPIMLEDLEAMLSTLPDTLLGLRDRALLLVGYAGAFRRSELVGLTVDDLDFTGRGMVLTLRKSKTDQEGKGRQVAIPYARDASRCPVLSLRAWMDAAGITTGPLLRAVDRHANVSDTAMSGQTVADIIKRTGAAAGIEPDRLSGHSLRAGLATSAALAGASERAIMQQTGHKSVEMVRRYIRDADMWRDNAAGYVL